MPEVDFDINVTALYDAIGKSDWDAASHACRRNPIEAETWVVRRDPEPRNEDDDATATGNILWRFLPLHSACARRPPSSFLRDLLKAYPEAASLKDESGMYPLHYACGNRASKHTITQLIDCFPQAVRESDPQKMLPLHYISQWGPSEDGIVELLLEVYVEGVATLNGEGMSPLDLCREGNFDEWKKVSDEMERFVKKKKSKRDTSSVGGRSYSSGKMFSVSVPREIEKEERDDSSVSSTIEVQRSKKSPRFSSRPRREGSSSPRSRRSSSRGHVGKHFDTLEEKPSSRSRRDRSSSRSRIERPPSQSHVERSPKKHFDTRDEISSSQPRPFELSSPSRPRRSSSRRSRAEERADTHDVDVRDEISTPRGRRQYESLTSFESTRPQSISCSLAASPRYSLPVSCDLETPRSSGRGPGFHFGQKTPRRSSGRGVEIDFENESSIRSQESRSQVSNSHGSALMNHLLHEKEAQQQVMDQVSHEKEAQQQVMNQLSQEKEAQQQILNHLSQEKENATYQVSVLQNENMELRAKLANYEVMQNENAQLRAKLTNYDTIQNENGQLHAKLANRDATQNENATLHAQLAKLQGIQSQLSDVVDTAERRESARIQASTERRKVLLEMLATEEKHDQAEKTNCQVRSIDGVRREMQHLVMEIGGRGGGNIRGGVGSMVDHRRNNIAGYRVNGAFE